MELENVNALDPLFSQYEVVWMTSKNPDDLMHFPYEGPVHHPPTILLLEDSYRVSGKG